MTETDLRWQLRQLPRDIDPPHDLWPGIAKGIARQSTSRWQFRWAPLAMAASVALAFGLTWHLVPMPGQTPAADLTAKVVQREAKAMTIEYRAALRQFDGAPLPAAVVPGIRTLDRSADQIRTALAADPDSVALLQQLRKTYSRRIELTQRAITG